MSLHRSLSLSSPAVFSIVLLAVVLAAFAQSGGGEQPHSAAAPAVSPHVGVPRQAVQATPPFRPGGANAPFGTFDSRQLPRAGAQGIFPRASSHQALSSPAAANASSIFREAPTYNSGGYEEYDTAVALADVNGDGHPDLLVVNYCASTTNCSNSTVGVLLGNGDGTFQAAVTYNSGGFYAYSVAVADVNGDGYPDLLVANNGAVGVLLGNGDGTFQAAVSYNSGSSSTTYVSAVAVADVNGDGHPDLLVANSYGVGVLLGNGDGTFQAAVSYSSGGEDVASIAVADVNGDGRPDLLVAAGNAVGVLLGNGDGTFQEPVSYNSGGSNAYSVAAADVNGDGKPDLLVANSCDNNGCFPTTDDGVISVLLGNGDGTFQAAVSYSSGGYYPYSVAVADVNGDGHPDLLVANSCNSSTGNRVYTCPAKSIEGSVGVLLGNGDGTFQAAVTYNSGGYEAYSVVVADVNGDAHPDLVVANCCVSSGNWSIGAEGVLLGNGDGTFQAAPNYNSGGVNAQSIAVADVNGDGKPDLLVANACADVNCVNGSVGVLLSNGDGTFQARGSYNSGGYYATSVAVADMNGDGYPDLLVANNCAVSTCSSGGAVPPAGVISVLLGNGDGTFQTAVNYDSGGQYAFSVVVADVNGDGKPDLLVANICSNNGCYVPPNGLHGNGSVSVLLGNGDGTFQTAVSYDAGGFNVYSVAVADVNGDGKPDLLVTNECVSGCSGPYSAGGVSVLLGNGDGTFQRAVRYKDGDNEAYSVAAADVNGDGKLDLLVANSGSLSVLLGRGDGTFLAAQTTPIPITDSAASIGPGQIVVADFDGDGKLDVAIGSVNALLLGNGDGTFQSPLVLGAGGPGTATGDFNGDGQPDLAVGGVTVLLNISTGFKLYASTTTLLSSLPTSVYGQAVTFTAGVIGARGAPTGTVTFADGNTPLGTVPLINGSAVLTASALSAASHSITATYSGDSNFVWSFARLSQTVNRSATTIALSSSVNPSYVNQTVYLTPTIVPQYGGAVTGTVIYFQGKNVVAELNYPTPYGTAYATKGERSISAFYHGDGNNLTSMSADVKQTVRPLPAATTTKATSSGTSYFNQPVTFTSTTTSPDGPIPDGEIVTFYKGTIVLGTGLTASGVASLTTSALSAVAHIIKAAYGGDGTFKSSSGTIKQVVQLYPSSVTVPGSSLNPSNYGQAVTFTATVTSTAPSTPTGTVTFKNGTATLGTATLNGSGIAALTKSNLPAGGLSITAAYNGDSETARSTSGPLTQTVNQDAVSMTLNSSRNPSRARAIGEVHGYPDEQR
ncbi:MAG: FG-GAP-like repeat-containing protein [Terriglobales bacterium]